MQLQKDIRENQRDDENAAACKVTPFRKCCYVIMHEWAVEKAWELFDTHSEIFLWNKKPFTWELVKDGLLNIGEDRCLSLEFLSELNVENEFFHKLLSPQKKKPVKHKKDLTKHMKLCAVMSMLRRTWFPCSGAGSQSMDYPVYIDMLKASLDFAEDKFLSYEEM
jgi:hypothetical protein